jgi:hypothetical protein
VRVLFSLKCPRCLFPSRVVLSNPQMLSLHAGHGDHEGAEDDHRDGGALEEIRNAVTVGPCTTFFVLCVTSPFSLSLSLSLSPSLSSIGQPRRRLFLFFADPERGALLRRGLLWVERTRQRRGHLSRRKKKHRRSRSPARSRCRGRRRGPTRRRPCPRGSSRVRLPAARPR